LITTRIPIGRLAHVAEAELDQIVSRRLLVPCGSARSTEQHGAQNGGPGGALSVAEAVAVAFAVAVGAGGGSMIPKTSVTDADAPLIAVTSCWPTDEPERASTSRWPGSTKISRPSGAFPRSA